MLFMFRAPSRARCCRAFAGIAIGLGIAASAAADPSEPAPPAIVAALHEVWSRNPSVQAAEAKLAAARAQSEAAAQPLYNPELELAAENADVDRRTVGLSQEIDWSGKRSARTGVASAEVRGAEAERDEVRQRAALDWLRGYAAYQVAREQVALGRARVDLLAQFAALAERRLVVGDIPSLERDLAELALQEARAQQAELLADQAKALQTLASVGGRAQALPDLPRAAPPPPSEQSASDWIEALPATRHAQAALEAANARIEVAERERRPNPTVALTAGRVTDGPFDDRLVGVSVRVPIFVRNSFRFEVVAARANAEAAEAAVREIRIRASAEVAQARESYAALRDAWIEGQNTRAASAADRAALLQRLWEAGEISTADYLVQLKQSLDTELTAAGLRARVWQAWADWLAASNGLASWLGQGARDHTTQD